VSNKPDNGDLALLVTLQWDNIFVIFMYVAYVCENTDTVF